MKPLVSVVIPTYNRSSLLASAIKSAQSQTYQNVEILVCDDGSTDNTKSAVKKLSKQDGRIHWISGKHSGRPAIPRNRGIKNSKGAWVAFLDDDDEWLSDKLEIQISLALVENTSAVCGNAIKMQDNQEVGNYFDNSIPNQLKFAQLISTNYVICSSALIKKSIIISVGLFPEQLELKALEDYALWLRISTHTPFTYIDQPILRYRDEPKNSIRKISLTSKQQKRMVIKDYLKWLTKNNIFFHSKNYAYAITKLI